MAERIRQIDCFETSIRISVETPITVFNVINPDDSLVQLPAGEYTLRKCPNPFSVDQTDECWFVTDIVNDNGFTITVGMAVKGWIDATRDDKGKPQKVQILSTE